MKRIALGLIVAVILAISYFWFASGKEESTASNVSSSQPRVEKPKSKSLKGLLSKPDHNSEEPLIQDISDLEKLPWPPPPPRNERELKRLVKRIVRMQFPECIKARDHDYYDFNNTDFVKDFENCMKRVYYEMERIRQIRDRTLVPELIDMAMKIEYKKRPEFIKKTLYKHIICKMRFNSIYSLGEIGYSRAIDPLVILLDEPSPSFSNTTAEGCMLFNPDDGGAVTSTCAQAADALKKFRDERLLPYFLSSLDNINIDSEQIYNQQQFQAVTSTACKLLVLPAYGPPALEAIKEKYNDPEVKEKQKDVLRTLVSEVRDPDTIPMLIELLHGNDEKMATSAAEALSGMASIDLIDEYIWMIYNGYVKEACEALSKINDPSTTIYLIGILENEDLSDDVWAAKAIIDIGPAAKDALPSLLKKLESCESFCGIYAKAIGSIGEERATLPLYEFIINNPNSTGQEGVLALASINSEESVLYLKEILAGEGKATVAVNAEYYSLLRFSAIDSLLKIGGKENLEFVCRFKKDPEMKAYLYDRCQ